MDDPGNDMFEKIKLAVDSYKNQIGEFDGMIRSDLATPPAFNLSDSYRRFAETLVSVPRDEQRPELEDYVKGQVDGELHSWVDRVNNMSSVREQVNRFSKRVEEEIRGLTALINAHRNRESQAKEELASLEADIVENEELLEQVRNPSRFDKATLWIVVVGVSLLAIATAYYYLATQGQIVVAQNGGPQNYFDSGAEKFSVLEFLKQSPLNILYGVGAIIFFLFGKFAGLVYERYGNPRGLFLSTVLLAGVVVAGTAALIAYSSSTAFILASAEEKYRQAISRIDDLSIVFGTEVDCRSADFSGDPACTALIAAEADLAAARTESGNLTLWVTLSVLMSEVMIGSAAWMYVEDYKRRHHGDGGTLTVQIAKMKQRLLAAKAKRDDIGRQVNDMSEAKQKLGSFQTQIANILARVPGGDAIETSRSHILNREQQVAWAQLLEVRKTWPHQRAGNG